MKTWRPVRPYRAWPVFEPQPFDPRQGIFIPEQSISNPQVHDISPRKLTGLGCKVYNSAAQAIPTATPTFLTFDTERWDQGGFFNSGVSTSKVYAPYAGIYDVVAYAEFAASAVGNYRSIVMYLNAAGGQNQLLVPIAGGSNTQVCVSTSYRLSAGDYLQVSVKQDSGGNLNVNAGEANNFLLLNFRYSI